MRVIIAGSRSINSMGELTQAIARSGFAISEVVSGGARGVDTLGERWAKSNNIPIKQFLPDWGLGRFAGFVRNKDMAKYVAPYGGLIIVWDGESRGVANMLEHARTYKLKTHVRTVTAESVQINRDLALLNRE